MALHSGSAALAGDLSTKVLREIGDTVIRMDGAKEPRKVQAWWKLQNALKQAQYSNPVGRKRLPAWAVELLGKYLGFFTLTSRLDITTYKPSALILGQPERRTKFLRLISGKSEGNNGLLVTDLMGEFGGEAIDYGTVCRQLVTDLGVAFLVDDWDDDSTDITTMNYHGIGLGTTAAAQTDTDVETELTTQYQTDNTRATGTKSQPSAPVLRSVGTNTVDATAAVTEHGLLSNATVGSGVLWDHHVFTVVNLSSGDSIQTTYDMTASAGG